MPIFEISYNNVDQIWETCEVDWDETRVLDAIYIDTYNAAMGYPDIQTDYSVCVEKNTLEEAFIEGVRFIREKINAI